MQHPKFKQVCQKGKNILIPLLSVMLLWFHCRITNRRIIKLAHALDTSHPVHEAMEFMSKCVEDKSNGQIKINIYPSQQLGTESQCLELLQIGVIGLAKVSAAVMEGFAPKYKVLSLPYIFSDKEHSYRVLDGKIGDLV